MPLGSAVPSWFGPAVVSLLLAGMVVKTLRAGSHRRRSDAFTTLAIALLLVSISLPGDATLLGLGALGLAVVSAVVAFLYGFGRATNETGQPNPER